MLRGSSSGYGDAAAEKFGSFQRSAISLPRLGAGAVDLASVASPELQTFLEVSPDLWRSPAEVTVLMEDAPPKPALDPLLATSWEAYGDFVSLLLERGIIEEGYSFETTGAFFCAQKVWIASAYL